ncbi:Zip-domain-containing protein [Stemphylium lycopersici]|nr:Zip-domain-containing protein [Stemphylium lycopersici]
MSSIMRSVPSTVVLLLAGFVAAQTATVTITNTVANQTTTIFTTSASPTFTAVSDCHKHSTVLWCMAGEDEYQVSGPTATEEFQEQYTSCHSHSSGTYCVDDAGEDVQILVDGAEEESHTDEEAAGEDSSGGERHCHEHAGIEHCVGGSASEQSCDGTQKDYNIGLRVGLLFVILVTSSIGVFTPILTRKFNLVGDNSIIFVVLKQFGTGIVISTAFVHLFTHAQLMFANQCLGVLEYEATTAAIFMAGLWLSFVVDYLGARFVQWRQSKFAGTNAEVAPAGGEDKSGNVSSAPSQDHEFYHSHAGHAHGHMHMATPMEEKINVMNLEAGIIFHSILIGITLVVASDGFFITLFIVILFHQMFEGIALGTCIAELPKAAVGTLHKLIMAGTFALITPLGMAIGIGVLNQFNGNDPSTIIAIGTLDALSAGILTWVGLVEMLARDWMHGKLMNAGPARTISAMFALLAGLILMSVLGKWA